MQPEQEWIGLKASLESLVAEYENFRVLCVRQRKALIENDITSLSTVLPQLEASADSILLIDDRRRMHMEILSEASTHEMLNLRELASEWPNLDFTCLEDSAAKLRAIRKEIEGVVRTNAALINSSRHIIHLTLDALVHLPEAGARTAQVIYGAQGTVQRNSTVRNLLNRKG